LKVSPPIRSGLLAVGLASAALAGGIAAAEQGTPRPAINPDGPPPAFTGGFGEQSCHACHFSAEPNQFPGRLSIDGLPETYAAGEVYPLRVALTRPRMARGGFQMAARFEDGASQAGSFRPGPGEEVRLSVVTAGEVEYVLQTGGGTVPVGAAAQWIVLWTAPEPNGPIRFDVAALAADGDGSASGDHVFMESMESLPESP